MTKTMKQVLGVAMAATAFMMAGCQAATPVAPMARIGEAPLFEAANGSGLKVLSPAASRRLMAASPSVARLWGMQFRTAWWATQQVGSYSDGSTSSRKRARDAAAAQGAYIIRSRGSMRLYVDIGWKADFAFEGEGGRDAMVQLEKAKFEYKVPAGRALVLNRIEAPSRITINDFPLFVSGLTRTSDVETVNYVFGPGETVIFTFPYGNTQSVSGRDGCNCQASLSGMTIDPAVLGGTLPGAGVEGEAK